MSFATILDFSTFDGTYRTSECHRRTSMCCWADIGPEYCLALLYAQCECLLTSLFVRNSQAVFERSAIVRVEENQVESSQAWPENEYF